MGRVRRLKMPAVLPLLRISRAGEFLAETFKHVYMMVIKRQDIKQACFFTDFAAIQDNGISLILSLEKTSLSLGENSLSLGGKFLSFRKST